MNQTVTTEQAMEQPIKKTRAINTPLDKLIRLIAYRIGGEGRGREIERFIKFAMIGVVGAIIDFGALNLLQSTVLPPVVTFNVALATSIAFVAAVLNNYFWNRFWTYPDSRSRSVRRQLVQFFVVSVIGWSARTLWISLSYASMGVLVVSLIQIVSPEFMADELLTNRLGSNASQLIAIFVVMIWNFLVNRYWTFNDVA